MAKRIYVKAPLFEGYAKIEHYMAGEMYPFQVVLEQPDGDGHFIKRVSKEEIVEGVEAF